ncbi:hypothetical protein Tco_0443005 [Tanacetum coccineum]
MLKRCEETNLVLNWEKCHFMVKEGIILGHKVSGSWIEVDKAKIAAISKLPYPTNVKAIRSFLGHADLGKLTKAEIRDLFLEERLMAIFDKNNEPWCVVGDEAAQILRQCHNRPSGGHHGITTTARKVFEAGFYWPHIFRDAHEMRLDAYETSISYKERTKRWHDKRIKALTNYEKGDKVILFNSCLRLFPGKLKSRWYRPFSVCKEMKNGAIELYDEDGNGFIVNKQRVKPYQKNVLDTNKDDDITLDDEGEVT